MRRSRSIRHRTLPEETSRVPEKPTEVCWSSGGNVNQPDHIVANPVVGDKAEPRPGPGEIWVAAAKDDVSYSRRSAYCWRSVRIGLTLAAREAGIHAAARHAAMITTRLVP